MQALELSLDSLDLSYGRLRVADRRREVQLMALLEEQGQQDAIRVVAGDDGRWIVVDGHKRVRALRRLRRDVVKAVVLEMSPAEAVAAMYRADSGPGRSAIEEGWLVYELHRVVKWDLGKTAGSLGRSKSWVSRRLGLVEGLPDAVLEGVRCGKLGAWSAMKHLLPLARANASSCERLAGKIVEASLSSRQVALVYEHFVKSGAQVKERILEDPAKFLKVLEATRYGNAGSVGGDEARCLKNLDLIGNISLGLARSLPAAVSSDTATAARERLQPVWERTRRRWDELSRTATAVFMAPAMRPVSEGGVGIRKGEAAAHVG